MMTATSRILVVDDDAELRDLLADFLGRHGFEVHTAASGDEMFKLLEAKELDLVVLDVMMPGEDGFECCRRLRAQSNLPVIMLTAVSDEADKIVGLEMGADDYLTKPFNPRELLARIKAIFRRTGEMTQEVSVVSNEAVIYLFAGWRLDTGKRCLYTEDDVEVTLSAGEYDLLLAMVERPQRVLSRDQLLEVTKNRSAGPFDRSIDVQISRIRQKIEFDAKNPQMIKTVRGGGYLFTATVKKQL